MKKLLFILLIFCSSLTYGQTKNIVPNSSHTGYLGTSAHSLYWAGVYTDAVNGIAPSAWRLKNDSLTWGLGLVQTVYSVKIDTANASILSRQRAVKEYLGKYATATNSALLENHAANYFEPALGNPATTGYVLSSTDAGVRSWVAQGGGGSMTYPSGSGIAIVSSGTSWGTTITDNSTNWNTAYDDRLKWDGGSTGLTATTGRTSLGGTTVGQSFFTLTNPSAITFPRINADNTVTALSASDTRTALGAQATLTNPITGTGTTNELAYWTSSSTQGTLAVATYPSLTELAYVKGVTSSVQTQITAKANIDNPTFTTGITSPLITLPTNGQVLLTIPSTDSHATGNITNAFNSGYSSSAVGDLVYLDASSTWQKCDKGTSVATYSGLLGIALEVKASGNALKVALPGSLVYATGFPALTVGSPVYMDDAGAIIVTQPTAADHAIRMIGWAVHADKIYFFPSPDYIIHN